MPPYPLKNSDLANRVAVVGAREGWCADYVRATYRRWFVEKQECGAEPNLSDSLREIGEDPRRVLALAETDEIDARLRGRDRRGARGSASSARRPSWRAARSSGATTGWRMP